MKLNITVNKTVHLSVNAETKPTKTRNE